MKIIVIVIDPIRCGLEKLVSFSFFFCSKVAFWFETMNLIPN
jgi:hypothetical protein